MNNIIAASLFIKDLQKVIDDNRLVFDPRNGKTYEFMLSHGLDTDDVVDILRQLKPSNYFDGPKGDKNGTAGDVMMFLYPYQGERVYIKIKIWKDKNGKAGVLISFHEEGNYD